MRYALIENGTVANVILCDEPALAASLGAVEAPDAVGPDWTHDGEWHAPAASVAVPAEITMRQARLALLAAGKLAAVEAAVDALSSPYREAAQIEWQYSNAVQRHNGFVAMLAPALGLDDAALDALFVEAAKL